MGEQTIIRLNNINKSYKKEKEVLHILKNITFDVTQGEFVAVLGPSGSGKSTLMNIIGCMDVFDDGEYFLNGINISERNDQELTKIRNQEIGFVFQKYHLIPTYTVLQNIIMPLLMRGYDSAKAKEECMDTIRLLGLDQRLKHKPSELSGGQQQRVAIARALVGKPTILLADEPTGALDTASSAEVLKLFKKLNEMGHTIVMITHDLQVAKAAKRIVRIVDGELFENQENERGESI